MILEDYEYNGRRSADRVNRALVHLRPTFEGAVLDEITELARGYVRERRGAGASLSGIRIELAALGRDLTLRHRARQIPYRPYLPHIRVENARYQFFEDVEALTKHLPDVIADLVRLTAITGFRMKEATRLRWVEIDDDFGMIRLPGSRTKNARAKIFPFSSSAQLTAVLCRRRAERCGEYVFHRRGKPISDFRGVWYRALELSGNEGKDWRDLRRTAARRMLLAGMPIKHIQALMGVRTLKVLLEHYLAFTEKDLEESVARL